MARNKITNKSPMTARNPGGNNRGPRKRAGPKPKRANARIGARALDASAAAYARLLADPCGAPLVHPTYSGSEGGYLIRAESFVTPGVGATENAGYFSWVPGLIGNAAGIQVGAAAGAGTSVAANNFGQNAPGFNFLRDTASGARCVAACLKVSYPGTEAGRAGRVHFGQTSGGSIIQGVGYTADNVAVLLPHYTRTPAQEFELVWKPNDADQLFRDPSALTSEESKSARAALTVAWAGLPVATGLTFRLTAVYEWQPASADGLSVPNMSRSPSENTLDNVINFLTRQGFTFVRGMAMAGTSGLISGISNHFGIMSAGVNTRRLAM
ncbi:hypothetical protein 3 [Changjiang tombus-like virus 7]|uniref:hypothetical protein 3 n=1 Tax=Changjiang tombus-like virus 7 TaxID=1922821 RepID=UPI00090A240A|nr:hypothetical protein 3 [Changjiang tombus-like virus 7]APG76273.1 hypothetical protein 3 [Changjiang tombus-like virus 7]